MSASYRIIESERLKYVKIVGKADYEELESLFYSYVRDPDFKPDLRLLVDLTALTDAVAGLWEIKKLKNLYQHAYRDAEDAVDVVILTGNDFTNRLARVFAFFMRDRKPMNIQISGSLQDALAKLQIKPETLENFEKRDRGDNVILFTTPLERKSAIG